GDLDAAESCLSEVLKHCREQKDAVGMAQVYTQQALLELKRGQAEAAALTLARSFKTQQAHGVAFFPEEDRIKKNILEQLAESDYETIAARAEAIDLTPDFILKDLPPARVGKDGKTMLLIAEGPVFIGEGEIERPSAEALADNIERYLYPYRERGEEYQLPPHPETFFDDEKFLFLLEKNQNLSAGEKQQTMDKIPAMAQKEIDELIEKLGEEYRATQTPKATEIYLYPYYMDREAVSNAEYEAFCAAADHARPGHWAGSKIPERAENLPVVNISLEDAKAYARWAGKELPTAQEWEKACRGEHGLRYPWGNDWDES
ncbi:MAG: formylglycine-generating enzyme family protein, partial [Gammaproteobacteria bacterium]|nr:formylglycine-generating enzyme family protein [Gammaproteobacteria bacterium]